LKIFKKDAYLLAEAGKNPVLRLFKNYFAKIPDHPISLHWRRGTRHSAH
jgi:hypothetical protein